MTDSKSGSSRTPTGFVGGAWLFVRKLPRLVWIVLLVFVGVLALVIYGLVKKLQRRVSRIQVRRRRTRDCSQSDTLTETIFVSIPSYRDSDCAATLLSLFNNAKCPYRIYVGVFSQQERGDGSILDEYERLSKLHDCDSFREQIRYHEVDARDALGPMYARAIIEQRLYRNEKWYLNIDSHTRFAADWDQHLLDLAAETSQRYGTPLNRVVLTMYPDEIKNEITNGNCDYDSLPPGAFLRIKKFHEEHGQVQIEGPIFAKRPAFAMPSAFCGMNCCFSSAERLKLVPFDPHCDYVFLGEETSMAARMWTHGFDMYNPPCMLLWHRWSRDYRPTFWENLNDKTKFSEADRKERQFRQRVGIERMWGLFGMYNGQFNSKAPQAPYSFGNVRSFEDYKRYCGIDWNAQVATHEAWLGLCGNTTIANLDMTECAAKFGSSRSDAIREAGEALKRANGKILQPTQ